LRLWELRGHNGVEETINGKTSLFWTFSWGEKKIHEWTVGENVARAYRQKRGGEGIFSYRRGRGRRIKEKKKNGNKETKKKFGKGKTVTKRKSCPWPFGGFRPTNNCYK